MKYHNKITRKIFNKIHLSQNNNKFSLDKIRYSLNEKILKLKKGYFKGKICADLGCGSTGSGGFNLLNLGANYCHLLDMHEHIKKPVSKNLKKFEGKFKISVGSLENLPYKKDSFDFALCQGVIHHMDNDHKGFKEIYRVLKKGGQAFISVHGKGGFINDFTMNFLRPYYEKNKDFKKLANKIIDGETKEIKKFLYDNYDKKTLSLFKTISSYLDNDLALTLKDRLLAPKYKTYDYNGLITKLKKIGFKKIYRVKKYTKFNNIRRLLEPVYYHYDSTLAKSLYGDGIIHFVVTK